MIEGMAQTAGVICILSQSKRESGAEASSSSPSTRPSSASRCVPGDTIEYHMTKIARKKNMWWYRGEAKVAGQLVAEAEVGAMIVVRSTDGHDRSDRAGRAGSADRAGRIDRPLLRDRPDVAIGDGCRLVAHVHVDRPHHDRRRAP